MHFSVEKLKIGGINVEASIKYGWAIGKNSDTAHYGGNVQMYTASRKDDSREVKNSGFVILD